MKQENKQFVPQVLTVPRGTRVEFPNVPAGHHRVVAWAPNARPVTLETDLGEGDSATLEFELKQQRPGPHTNKDGMAYGSYKD